MTAIQRRSEKSQPFRFVERLWRSAIKPGGLPQFGKTVSIDGRVLPNIEPSRVKAKDLNLIDPGLNLLVGDFRIAILQKCRADLADVGQQARRPMSSFRPGEEP